VKQIFFAKQHFDGNVAMCNHCRRQLVITTGCDAQGLGKTKI